MKTPAKLMYCPEQEGEGSEKAKTKEEQTDLQETIHEAEQANVTKELGGREATRACWLVPRAVGDRSEEGKHHILPPPCLPWGTWTPLPPLPSASSPQCPSALQNVVPPLYSLYLSLDCQGRKAPASPTAPGQCQRRSRDKLPQKPLCQAASPAASSRVPAGLHDRGAG